jgi:hypothetical protein
MTKKLHRKFRSATMAVFGGGAAASSPSGSLPSSSDHCIGLPRLSSITVE